MPENSKATVDVADTLEELHQVTEVAELDTSGTEAGPLGQIHPIGWTVLALLAAAVIFHAKGSDWLIGNFAWWHWAGLLAVFALSLRPGPIKAVSGAIDTLSDFFEQGANHFARPWSVFAAILFVIGVLGLLIGPLRSLADWIFGVSVDSIGGGDFEVSSSNAGWVRTFIAVIVLAALTVGVAKVAAAMLPDGPISIRTGGLLGVAAFVATFLVVGVASAWSTGVTSGFAIGILVAAVALGPLWIISWGIFITIFFYVITRYTARFIEADIIIGEVNSLGLNLFGVLALLGVGYGVKAGINPRIDFWWAEFSNRRKAWLDFVLHAVLLMPFLWASLRILHPYAKENLGFKPDRIGNGDGEWPASWHVWETWKQAADAGNLPTGPVRSMIFVGFVLFIAQIFSEMVKSGFVLMRREDLAELKVVDAPTRVE